MRISVVIPTLNEAATIAGTLRRLSGQGADEVIVVDASSPDGTATLARSAAVVVVDSPRGRGAQQNRGAAAASGDVLVFLHADCRLEDCIVSAGVRIGAGSTVNGGAVLGEGVTVGAGNVLTRGIRIFPGTALADEAIRF